MDDRGQENHTSLLHAALQWPASHSLLGDPRSKLALDLPYRHDCAGTAVTQLGVRESPILPLILAISIHMTHIRVYQVRARDWEPEGTTAVLL